MQLDEEPFRMNWKRPIEWRSDGIILIWGADRLFTSQQNLHSVTSLNDLCKMNQPPHRKHPSHPAHPEWLQIKASNVLYRLRPICYFCFHMQWSRHFPPTKWLHIEVFEKSDYRSIHHTCIFAKRQRKLLYTPMSVCQRQTTQYGVFSPNNVAYFLGESGIHARRKDRTRHLNLLEGNSMKVLEETWCHENRTLPTNFTCLTGIIHDLRRAETLSTGLQGRSTDLGRCASLVMLIWY